MHAQSAGSPRRGPAAGVTYSPPRGCCTLRVLLQGDAVAPAAGDSSSPVLAALRGLGVKGKTIMQWQEVRLRRVMILPLRAMGQYWKSPPGPDGWPEDTETWITPQGLAERIGWAMRWPTVLADPPPQPRDFADRVLGDRAAPATVWATERAESLAEGLGIVLSSPEFNRR